MTIVEWSAILSPILSVIIAVVMIRYNNRDTRKLVDNLRKLARTNVELNIQQLELDLRREQLLSGVQHSKHNYFSDSYLSGYQKTVADHMMEQYKRVEEPKLLSEMHQEYLAIQQSYLEKLKELKKGF